MNAPLLPAERAERFQRCAVARFVAARDRYPNQTELDKEAASLAYSLTQPGAKSPAEFSRADAVAWLKAGGFFVPAVFDPSKE